MRRFGPRKRRRSMPRTIVPTGSTQSRRRISSALTRLRESRSAVRRLRDSHVARPSELRRGDVWMVDFGPEIGEHPALLVARTGSMRRRWRAIVALITSEAIGLPTEVPVGPQHGL